MKEGQKAGGWDFPLAGKQSIGGKERHMLAVGPANTVHYDRSRRQEQRKKIEKEQGRKGNRIRRGSQNNSIGLEDRGRSQS